MCIYDIIDELMNINEIKCKTSNQIFTETFHNNSMRFSAITLFYYAQYSSIQSRPLSMTFKYFSYMPILNFKVIGNRESHLAYEGDFPDATSWNSVSLWFKFQNNVSCINSL